MSLLIPGPRSPDRETDVYLQPLIEELKKLWSLGVRNRLVKSHESNTLTSSKRVAFCNYLKSVKFPNSVRAYLLKNVYTAITELYSFFVAFHFLKWTDVTPEYIELVKGSLQEQSSMNRAARAKQPYNHSSDAKSFLHRQHELAEQRGHPINRVDLFKETNVRGGQLISSTIADAHVDDRVTQKVLVGAPSQSPNSMLAVLRLHSTSESWCSPKEVFPTHPMRCEWVALLTRRRRFMYADVHDDVDSTLLPMRWPDVGSTSFAML
ncbi:CACTA en-spm transposon protein [Cucumis melo var. makuwa]|uniref:CACTA en-spm transposon protein n=1 Tax=Cucumis melo var. makuwa TaxID=1194695 RepID=A0A5A7VA20_CUCMM|nr:CACTA en-spm transposon protein [Cucumis melo var. makuwa]TYK26233.1 CACTA en-spm transposon protein [Cucumis melo var. makuwa]